MDVHPEIYFVFTDAKKDKEYIVSSWRFFYGPTPNVGDYVYIRLTKNDVNGDPLPSKQVQVSSRMFFPDGRVTLKVIWSDQDSF